MGGGGSIGQLEGRIVLDINQALGAYSNIRQAHLGVVTDTRQMSLAFTEAGSAMMRAGTGILGALGKAAGAAADFNKRLDYFAAVTNTSDKGMQQLRKSAVQWAQDSIYSTSQVADGLVELGKAGVSAETLVNGLGEAIINLGQAADIGVVEASQIMVSTMSQFSLEASKAVSVADRLSGTANASIIDMKDLGVTMKYAGGITHALGGDLDDLTTAIALLGNAGIRGSMAGTSLRQMMVSLNGSTKPAIKAMKELGIITKDGSNKFFDLKGNIKPLPQVFQILQDSMKGYTNQQKTAYLRTIFNNRALTAASILTKEGAKGFNKMNAEIAKTTTADVAAKRLNNLAGDVEILRGNIQTFLMQAGSPFQNFLRGLTQAATQVLQAFTSLPPGVQSALLWIVAIGAVLLVTAGAFIFMAGTVIRTLDMAMRLRDGMKALKAGFGGAKGAISGFSKMVGGSSDALGKEIPLDYKKSAALDGVATSAGGAHKGLGFFKKALLATLSGLRAATVTTWAFTAALLANPITWIVIAIIALAVALVLLYKHSETFRKEVQKLWSAISTGAKKVWGWLTKLPDLFQKLWDKMGGLKGALKYLIPGFAQFKILQKIAPMIGKALGKAFSALGAAFAKLPGIIGNGLAAIPGALGYALGFIAGWFAKITILAFVGILNFVTSIMTGLASLLPKIASWVGYALGYMIGFFIRLVILAVKGIAKLVSLIWTGLMKLPGLIAQWGVMAWTAFTAAITSIIAWVTTNAPKIGRAILNAVQALPGQIAGIFQSIWNFITSLLSSIISWVGTNAPRVGNTIISSLTSLPGRVWGIITSAVGKISAGVGSAISAAKRFGQGAINGFMGVISGLPGLATGAISKAISAFRGMIGAAFSAAKSFAGGLWEGFKDGLGINSPSYIEKALWQITGVADAETKRLKSQVSGIQKVGKKLTDISLSPGVDLSAYDGIISQMKAADAVASKFAITSSTPAVPTPVPVAPVTKEVTNTWAPVINNPEPEKASDSMYRTAQKVAYLGLEGDNE